MKKSAALLVLCLVSACSDKALAYDLCGLSGFDLGTLDDAKYWTFRVPDKRDCVLPLGYTEDDVEGCNIYISVCKPLGNTTCRGYPNSTTCQQVVMSNLDPFYYDMGTYTDNFEFSPLANATGFFAPRMSDNAVSSEECNDTMSTNIFFRCDEDAVWDHSKSVNVTQHVAIVEQLVRNPCQYLVILQYSGACYISPTLSPSLCSIEGYDTSTISNRDYWIAHIPAEACVEADEYTCILYLAFCHPVPTELDTNCFNAAVCQKGTNQDEQSHVYSLGSFTNFTRFYKNDEQGDGAGFHMRVENGSKPENGSQCKNGLMSEVILVCGDSSPWNSQDISEHVQLVHRQEDPCLFVVKISYSGACFNNPGVSKSRPSPVGWILIGLFLGAVLGYVVVGSAIGYFVKGERGLRVLPQYDFWRNVGILIMEGCKFSWDVITCHRFGGKVMLGSSRGQPDYDKI